MVAYLKLLSAAAGLLLFTIGSAHAESASHATEPVGALSEMILGDEDAPVTVIEYASLTCSHCAHWQEEIYPAIKKDYIDTGKIRFILRDLPVVPAHPTLIARSYAGSMIARCAADTGGSDSYFAVMHKLFETQESWAFGEDARGELLQAAAEAGIDEPAFDACLQRADLKAHIDRNVEIARNDFEIQGTPSFVINGEYERFQSFEAIFEALDAAIAAAE